MLIICVTQRSVGKRFFPCIEKREIVIWRCRLRGAKRPWLSLWESWLPRRGRLRGCRTIEMHFFPTAVPSQSACSADSSPKGRAKGAAAPVRQITISRHPCGKPHEKPAELGFTLRAYHIICYFHRPSGYRPCSVMAFSAATTTGLSAA